MYYSTFHLMFECIKYYNLGTTGNKTVRVTCYSRQLNAIIIACDSGGFITAGPVELLANLFTYPGNRGISAIPCSGNLTDWIHTVCMHVRSPAPLNHVFFPRHVTLSHLFLMYTPKSLTRLFINSFFEYK